MIISYIILQSSVCNINANIINIMTKKNRNKTKNNIIIFHFQYYNLIKSCIFNIEGSMKA